MKKSDNQEVQKLLNGMKLSNEGHYEILQELRRVVFEALPKVTERVMYGGIMFTLIEDFGGIFSSKSHVSFEFSKGYMFVDSRKVLEGTGKKRRHLKIESLSDIASKEVRHFVKQAGESIE